MNLNVHEEEIESYWYKKTNDFTFQCEHGDCYKNNNSFNGVRSYGEAFALLEFNHEENIISLTLLGSNYPNEGHGTTILTFLKEMARMFGYKIKTYPSALSFFDCAYNATDNENIELKEWYLRQGFFEEDDGFLLFELSMIFRGSPNKKPPQRLGG